MKVLAAVGAACVLLAAAGCGGGDEPAARNGEGRVPPKLVDTPAVEGGTAGERQLLRRVVAGMQETALARIEIARRGKTAEAVAIEFAPVAGETARRQWEQWIVAGALSRRLLAADSPALVDGSDDRGGFRARPKLKGNPDPGPLTATSEKALLKDIRGAVKASGGDLVKLEAHRPYGVAIALSVSTDDPARFLAEELRGLLAPLSAHRRHVEGVYLAVLENRRELVLEWGSWTRNPAGTFWVREDLADCSPIKQTGPPGTEPPPRCPAG